VLQAQARPALLRGLSVATLALRAGGIGHRVAFIEDDDTIEVDPEPVDDLVDAGFLGAPFLGAQRGIGGEEDALGAGCRGLARSAKAASPADAPGQALTSRAARLPAACRSSISRAPCGGLGPVVEQDPGRLAALARPGAIAKEEAATEADGVSGIVGRGRDHVAGFIDSPRPRETGAMRFTRVDHGLQLRVGQQAIAQDGSGQFRAVGRFWGRDRGHGRRLHQLGRVRFRAGDVDRLQAEGLVDRIRQARSIIVVAPLAQGVGEVFGLDLSDACAGWAAEVAREIPMALRVEGQSFPGKREERL
jgi:hypothetical protein